MAQHQILADVSADLKAVEPKIADVTYYIKVLKDAGENTVKMEADLRTLLNRKAKWDKMLKAEGF